TFRGVNKGCMELQVMMRDKGVLLVAQEAMVMGFDRREGGKNMCESEAKLTVKGFAIFVVQLVRGAGPLIREGGSDVGEGTQSSVKNGGGKGVKHQ
ncbi:hypothetical protein KI387_026249, partial [Taxus chinensis]